MNREIKALALSVAFASSLCAEQSSKITVFVYNYAVVSGEALARAEAEASRIYERAGIQIEWLECPLRPQDARQFPECEVAPGPDRLALRLLSHSMSERLLHGGDSFGFALYPEDGSFATVANVFAHDAGQLASRRGINYAVILGHLLAHEMGHLLLGARSHSSIGIMRAAWHVKELETIAQGRLMFTPAESETLRRNIQARVATERESARIYPP
jgi:hypothetical protein